ncbi:MAG TPA: iron chelate uptake ABC transporter family permease subunit [Candidatus Wallbacteria bacterium]|nr:iron chelate uptake ABC transporter family permease subunit [Candidatus Wallbacteria bacterium]
MINEFILSWQLFKYTYLAGWSIGLLLSLLGVLIVARDQIFIGAAISQASALGISLALVILPAVSGIIPEYLHECLIVAMAVIFSIAASWLTSNKNLVADSHEAVTGFVFLACSSLSVILVSKSPHGTEEINRLLSSSIIGATIGDVSCFAALFLVTALTLRFLWRHFTLIAIDNEMAFSIGIPTSLYNLAFSIWLGLALGLSIRVSGMLFVFGGLVLPALAAKNFSHDIKRMFILSPIISLISNILAFVFANYYDYPPAQISVAFLSFILMSAWFIKIFRRSDG